MADDIPMSPKGGMARVWDAIQQQHPHKAAQVTVAEHINTTRQAVYMWRHIPARHIGVVQRLSGLAFEELRPDLFPGIREWGQ